MAYQNMRPCFVCNLALPLRQLSRLDGDANINKREIAMARRNVIDLPPLEMDDLARLCINCNRSIIEEIRAIELDPACMRLNVLTQTSSHTCFICGAIADLRRLTLEARVKIFVNRDIYIPKGVRSCQQHLDDEACVTIALLPGLRFVNRPYVIKGAELQSFLQGLRQASTKIPDFSDESNLNDADFKCLTSLTKDQFHLLLTYCDPVPENGKMRHVYKKDLLTFLCKMRQGISDEFLKVIFRYSSRQAVSLANANVRKSLMQRFATENVGHQAITREDYIARHVTPFANELYNPNPEVPKAIACVDGTYSYINKSSNFRTLRQSFSLHKGRHLVKPAMIVAPDGYILAVHGPYFSDSRNNDAQMLINEFENDVNGIRAWFQEGDILIVDRGYRDAGDYLEALDISYRMPHVLLRGRTQFTTEEANETRLITKTRWVIKSRNGHIKSVFKFFDNVIEMPHVENLKYFYLIAAALLNRFHPPIQMTGADVHMARRMLDKSREPNVVQARVEIDNLQRRRGQWARLEDNNIAFPRLSLDYLRNLTFGIYQISLAPSYVQEKLQREENEEFQIDELMNERGFLRIRVYSRFRNRSKYEIYISYNENVAEGVDENLDNTLVDGYYCTCKTGARTLGTCAHVASVLWYLGYARYEQNVHYPSVSLLNTIMDAAHRPPQIDLNNPRIIEG